MDIWPRGDDGAFGLGWINVHQNGRRLDPGARRVLQVVQRGCKNSLGIAWLQCSVCVQLPLQVNWWDFAMPMVWHGGVIGCQQLLQLKLLLQDHALVDRQLVAHVLLILLGGVAHHDGARRFNAPFHSGVGQGGLHNTSVSSAAVAVLARVHLQRVDKSFVVFGRKGRMYRDDVRRGGNVADMDEVLDRAHRLVRVDLCRRQARQRGSAAATMLDARR